MAFMSFMGIKYGSEEAKDEVSVKTTQVITVDDNNIKID